MRKSVHKLNRGQRFGAAALMALVGTVLQYKLFELYGLHNIGVLYPVVFIVSWYLGMGPAALTVTLEAVGAYFLLLYEIGQIGGIAPRVQPSSAEMVRLFIFFFTALIVARLIDRGRNAERRYKLLQDRFERSALATDLGVWYCDLPFDELIWNSATRDHFFVAAEGKILISDFYDHLHPDDVEKTKAAIDASIQNHSVYDIQFRTCAPHNLKNFKWIRAVGWTDYDSRGRPLHFDGISLDVTAQIVGEEELRKSRDASRQSEQQLRIIADQIPSFIGYMDSEGRYQFVNRAYEEWFGMTLADIRGKRRSEFTTSETAGRALPYEVLALSGQSVRYENVLTRPDGKIKDLDIEYIPHVDSQSGEIRGAVVVGHDVTQRNQALEDVKLMATNLQDAIVARDTFLSIASHELRTPLTGMKLQTQLIERAIQRNDLTVFSPARVTKLVTQVNHGLDRMGRLVEDMLDISRIQSGKLLLKFEIQDLGDVIKESLERFEPQLEQAKIKTTAHIEQGLLIELDRFRIEQVFTNLITNALRYAPGAPLLVECKRHKEMARLMFQDSGPGIAPENQELIFQRFERLISANEISGLGLGLYIVREIVHGHGGQIRAEGEAGHGARFVIELPIANLG